jgi:catechol 2,3-dioxygenase-like lactoylglutathione lyase family enzyme
MAGTLWNIGIKVQDLDQEIGFLEKLGARLLLREILSGPDGASEYAFLEFGGTRLFLTRQPIFETKLSFQLQPGLTHAVFEVNDLDSEYERITALGMEVLIEPVEISAGFGSRRIAFSRSPNGFIFEMMQILEAKI